MKKKLIVVAFAVLALSLTLFGQGTAVTTTTLSTAVTSSNQNQILVASATGISASTNSLQYYIFVDRELMKVNAVSGTTLTVARGQGSTVATKHVSGAAVFFGPIGNWDAASGTGSGVFLASDPIEGTPCTATANPYLPFINSKTGMQTNCIGSQWRSLGPSLSTGNVTDVILCGDLPNNTTNYFGAASGFAAGLFFASGTTANDLSYALAGSGCSALDSTTEATADTVLFVNNTFRVLGMNCTVSSSGSNGLTLNFRASTASLTPDVTITIPTGSTTGAVILTNPPTVAANAPVDVRAIVTEDLSAQDAWCSAKIQILP
jgi:hypothetical protein